MRPSASVNFWSAFLRPSDGLRPAGRGLRRPSLLREVMQKGQPAGSFCPDLPHPGIPVLWDRAAGGHADLLFDQSPASCGLRTGRNALRKLRRLHLRHGALQCGLRRGFAKLRRKSSAARPCCPSPLRRCGEWAGSSWATWGKSCFLWMCAGMRRAARRVLQQPHGVEGQNGGNAEQALRLLQTGSEKRLIREKHRRRPGPALDRTKVSAAHN